MWTSKEETLSPACQSIYQNAKMKIAWVCNEKRRKQVTCFRWPVEKLLQKPSQNNKGVFQRYLINLSLKYYTERRRRAK